MTQYLKVAAAQLGPIHLADERPAVVQRLIAMMREAHGAGCKLVVYPELALTTFFPRYWMEDKSQADRYFEPEMPNPDVQPLFDEAKKLGVAFKIGYAELTEEHGETKHYNTAILVGPDGEIVGKYRKVHLPGHDDNRPNLAFQHLEKYYFDVGNLGFPVWRAFDRVMGMCICNDRRWPETYRVMGLRGVEMILLGYNTPDTNQYHNEPVHLKMFHNHLTMQSGAYQNGTWVVAAAKAGPEDGYGMIAGSCIIAPTGELVAQALTQDDEVVTYDCDMDLADYIKRTVFDFDRHRRIEHYGLISEQVGSIPPPK